MRNLIEEGITQVQSPTQMRSVLNQPGIRRSQRGRRDILGITGAETTRRERSHRHTAPDGSEFRHSHPVDLDENNNVISHDPQDRNEGNE
jgi:hypothetical protein